MALTKDHHGNKVAIRALCDSGSQLNLISTNLVQTLRLQGQTSQIRVLGFGGTMSTKGKVSLQLFSMTDDKVSETIEAFAAPRLLGILPQTVLDKDKWPHIKGLQLADKDFNIPSTVDVILGADFYARIVGDGVIRRKKSPTAQNTSFGWIIFGEMGLPTTCNITVAHATLHDDDLLKQIARFWEMESVPSRHFRTSEEEECERLFTRNVARDKDGRYITRIPIRENAPAIINSRAVALSRLRNMHRRFKQDATLRQNYLEFIDEYLRLGHMELVPAKELRNPNAVYIPHHAAGTSKFRVVFDASCATKGSPSLNDNQLNGEKLQPGLVTTIMSFRIGRVAICADIAKMYRQILVSRDQHDLQRILWAKSDQDPIREYRLKTQTYGMKSAAYICIRTLFKLADDYEIQFREAAETIRTCFYVDDLLKSVESAEKAILMHHQLNQIMSKGCFQLAKWISNDPTVNETVNRDNPQPIEIDKEQTNALLGLRWNPTKDTFQFQIRSEPSKEELTKRVIVADIARLYDPIGFLSPVIVIAKIIIQRLWQTKLGWDDKVTGQWANEWLAFRRDLQNIESISIPRWINTSPNCVAQLHGFADASENAYGVAFYIRTSSVNDQSHANLVFSKTKVAPIAKATVPKLELSAAHLMAKLLKELKDAHRVDIDQCYLWTDSMIVIHWISKSPSKLETFQANRVAEIQEWSEGATWRHVVTKDNPADLASRGTLPSKLATHTLWWHGPGWLISSEKEWPTSNAEITGNELKIVNSAMKKSKPIIMAAAFVAEEPITIATPTRDGQPPRLCGLLEKTSDWNKLLNISAYVLRFAKKIKPPTMDARPSAAEKLQAEKIWLKYSQQCSFAREIERCREGQAIDRTSSLQRLTPFLDGDGILRLSGRIKRSGMPYDTVHPIILSSKCPLARRLVEFAHKTTLHGGIQLTQQFLREKYWIMGLRRLVRDISHQCIPCLRQRKEHAEQLMGQLPEARLKPGRAFQSTSIDYLGPVLVKRYNAARVKIVDKAYVAVFVCMRTRAIHLELVSSLTTEAFLAAFSRFTHRRGRIEEIWSDNATTFQGADAEMKVIEKTWREAAEGNFMSNKATHWKFIPPRAPHMGGLHEAAVKSTKHHLRRVVGCQQLTFEQLATLLVHVEACLNSRPLSAIKDESSDMVALTPGHFLIGEPLLSPLTRDHTRTPASRLGHFQLLQKFAQEFWERWSNEHVKGLINRAKWHQSQTNVKKGDIVLVLNELLPPTQWPLGRIIETYPDAEGHVRKVDVLFNGSVLQRPIHKLCPLPIERAEPEAPSSAGEHVQN